MNGVEIQNEQFHSEMNKIFESYLSRGERPQILVRNKNTGQLLTNLDYSLLLFDQHLNIYKKAEAGGFIKVDNPDFDAVVVKVV